MSENDPEDPTRTTDEGAIPTPHSGPLEGARFAPGTVLASRYRVVGLLGRGGMGEVYRADDLRLRQTVALKFLPERVATDPVRLARFHNEVRVARQVSHANVCRVHDIGEADGLTFLSMEYVDGEDLASLLRRVGRLTADRASTAARQICAGLAAAHDSGVLHRDLKPANVMIDGKGRARLTDFGLALAAGEASAGEVVGTPAYMAPEQVDGRDFTVRSDVYALGLVLYELFTGHPAFRADSAARLLDMHRTAVPAAPSRHVPDLDPAVERVILRCLEKDPERRPASARGVAAALGGGAEALEAVLAAGETPSPEMVAAAGEEGALRPWVAVGAFVLALTSLAAILGLCDRVLLINQVPFEKPPDALAERARALIGSAGPGPRSTGQAMGFAFDERFLEYRERRDPSPALSARLSSGQPAAVYFWYRQAPRELHTLHPFGQVTEGDPPPGPGMVAVRLDTRGRLIALEAVPPEDDPAGSTAAPPDWVALLGAAGLDPARLRTVAPARTPPVFADSRGAWEGAFPDHPDLPLRVEAAALNGRLVWFRLLGPWDEPRAAVSGSGGAGGFVVLQAVLFVSSVLLARRNLRLGRGDRRGAFRLAAVVFACRMLLWLLYAGHDLSSLGSEWSSFEYGLARALYFTAWIWALYVALEPYVRRRWPGALISWSRLVSGRFRDPLVGRDVLVGVLLSSACALLLIAGVWATSLRREAPRVEQVDLDQLLGARYFLAALLAAVVRGVRAAMFLLLALLVLRMLTRRPALATVGFVLLWTAVFVGVFRLDRAPWLVLVMGAMVALVALALVRFGLLAVAVFWFVSLLGALPTTRWSAWHGQSAMLFSLVFAGLAGFGCYAALGRRPLLEHWLEE